MRDATKAIELQKLGTKKYFQTGFMSYKKIEQYEDKITVGL